MDHLFKKYPMGHFAMLTRHEQLVETVLHIDQRTFYKRFMKLSVDRWITWNLLRTTVLT